MNERIRELARQSTGASTIYMLEEEWLRFAELIVRECKENFAKVWYEQGMDIRGAELDKFLTRFEEHFGVEE
jgi:hypothetical protein